MFSPFVFLLWLSLDLSLVQGHKGCEQSTDKSSGASNHYLEAVVMSLDKKFLSLSQPSRLSHASSKRVPPKLDIIFALDASAGSSADVFDYQRKLTERLIDAFSISPSGTRVAIVSCASTYAHFNFFFHSYVNKEAVIKFLPTLRYQKADRALGACLQSIHWQAFQESRDKRKDAKKIIFVMTTGKSPSLQLSPSVPAELLKKEAVEIFGLNIGLDDDGYQQLKGVVSQPIRDHMFRIPILHDIKPLYYMLKGKGAYPSSCSNQASFYDECDRLCQCNQGLVINCTRIRKDFLSMTEKERSRFVKALIKIATDKRYRGELERLVEPHKMFFNPMIHSAKYFLPWHRAFLLKIENLLRRIDCRITVPYWDWTLTSGNPWSTGALDLWSSKNYGLGGNGTEPSMCVTNGPFKKGLWDIGIAKKGQNCLKRNFNGTLPDAIAIHLTLETPIDKFQNFELILRFGFHHYVTCAVGGTSCSVDNARSPEYLLIASFIDKLWGQWQDKSRSHWPMGFPVVSDLLPGFFIYTGEVLQLSNQPVAIRVNYKNPTRKPAAELRDLLAGIDSSTLQQIPRHQPRFDDVNVKTLYQLSEVEQIHFKHILYSDYEPVKMIEDEVNVEIEGTEFDDDLGFSLNAVRHLKEIKKSKLSSKRTP